MSIKDMKAQAEQRIVEELKKGFDEKIEIAVAWGIPAASVEIRNESEKEKNIWGVSFNLENFSFELSHFASIIEDGIEKPAASTITHQTLEFIFGTVSRVTNEVLGKEKSEEEVLEEMFEGDPSQEEEINDPSAVEN